MRWWRYKEGFLGLSTFYWQRRGELIQIALFLLVLFLALWRVERETAFLYFEDEGSLELLVEGAVIKEDVGLSLRARVVGGGFPELFGRVVSVKLYGMEDVPSKAFWLYGKVKAEGDKFFVSASWRDIEGISQSGKSLRERYIQKAEERIEDPQVRALTFSYLFGESQSLLPNDIYHHFRETGLVHILVISGFHVAMFFLVLRHTLPYPYGIVLATLGTSLYVLFLTPKDPPALRAWLMFLTWVLIKLLQGRPNSLSILFFSGSLLLLFDPSFSKSFSFWLSFFAVLYIILGTRLIKTERKVIEAFLVSFFAFLGVSPMLWSFTTNSAGSIFFTPLVGTLFLPFTIYGILEIITYFSLPTFPMELLGKLILFSVKSFSYFDLEVSIPLSLNQAIFISSSGAIAMYAFGIYREEREVK
ncbi:MAG: ComEC/Rec2 family competence protein [Aquificaceae bacterium]